MRVDTPCRPSVSTLPNPTAHLRPNLYHGHRFARKVIARAVRFHPRLAPSIGDVEELLAPSARRRRDRRVPNRPREPRGGTGGTVG